MVKVTIENGRIAGFDELSETASGLRYKSCDVKGRDNSRGHIGELSNQASEHDVYICPGFIDLQVNGFGGHDLNQDDITSGQVRKLVFSLHQSGVTGFLPTLITGSHDRLSQAVHAIREAVQRSPIVARGIMGIHLEGPFLSGEDGPRGAHDIRYIRDPDWDFFESLYHQSGGLIRMVTLAPERPGSIPFIRRLKELGVVVALGHTAATEAQIAAAVDAGATLSTHLGNGSHPLLPRHENYMFAQLAEDRLWAGVIGDGHHLSKNLLRILYRSKLGKVALVSDAVHLAGLEPGVYFTNIGGKVDLQPNGRLQLYDDPRILAGAATGIDTGIQTILRATDIHFSEAISLVTKNPAKILSEFGSRGSLHIGEHADMTLVAWDKTAQTVHVIATIVEGQLVYESDGRAASNVSQPLLSSMHEVSKLCESPWYAATED